MGSEERGSFWSTLPGILTGLAAVLAAVTGLYVALNNHPTTNGNPTTNGGQTTSGDSTEPPKKPQMGPLENGIGLDHNDLSPTGWLSVASAEACSDLCYARDDCFAMTYVISNKSCWLKYAVPARTGNADEISAVKLKTVAGSIQMSV